MMSKDQQSQTASDINSDLVSLSLAVLPVWAHQLATSRTQSEAAVSEMISAFAEIGPHLDRAARQSHQITAALSHGEGGITQLAQACDNELTPLLARLDEPAAAAIRHVLAMVGQSVAALEDIAKPFEHETQMVTRQVDRMYVGFQYQDRISQMITLLHEDIQRLQTILLAPGTDRTALAPQAWLARLESQYAMAEQHLGHVANTPSGDDSQPDNGIDTTFF